MAEPISFDEPPIAKRLFGTTTFAWLWLLLRVYHGWEWFVSGWGKTFGGQITLEFWRWGASQYSLTGSANCGWIRSCVVNGHAVPRGGAVKGFAAAAVANSMGPHPDVAYSWYVDFLKWIRDDSYGWIGPVVSITELVIGILLIIGLFTGIAAFIGASLNFSYVFAGTAGVNPLFIIISLFLIMAWRVAGWYGLDRIVLPKLGTPWQPGSVFRRKRPEPASAPSSSPGS